MKKITLLLTILLITVSSYAKDTTPDFHRLLILDNEQRLMLVKIKSTDFWVTPGLYDDGENDVNTALQALAAEYGIVVSKPILGGKFKLYFGDKVLTRYFYTAQTKELAENLPENIEAIKWLPFAQASKQITFPHISMLSQKLIEQPQIVWQASIKRYREADQYKAVMVEDFSPLKIKNSP